MRICSDSGTICAEEVEDDDEPFEEKMARLTKELEAQFEESDELEKNILKGVKNLSFSNEKQ